MSDPFRLPLLRQSVEQLLQEDDDLEMDKVELLMNERVTDVIQDIGGMIKVVEGKGKFGRKSARKYLRRELG